MELLKFSNFIEKLENIDIKYLECYVAAYIFENERFSDFNISVTKIYNEFRILKLLLSYSEYAIKYELENVSIMIQCLESQNFLDSVEQLLISHYQKHYFFHV
jgi:hypothetical protein